MLIFAVPRRRSFGMAMISIGLTSMLFCLPAASASQESGAEESASANKTQASPGDEIQRLEARVDQLIEQLDNSRTRTTALKDIRQLDPAAAPILIERFTGMRLSPAQVYLGRALGEMDSAEVHQLVAEKLSNAENGASLRSMLETILSTAGNRARSTVNELAAHDKPTARESGMRLLGGAGRVSPNCRTL